MDGVRLSLGSLFPNLAHLYVCSSGSEPEVPAQTLDLSGVALRTLVFKDARMYALSAAKRKSLGEMHVPVVHQLLHQPKNMDWHCPLGWMESGGTIHVRLETANLGLTVFVAPEDRSFRRSYTFKICDLGSKLPLCYMPGLCARLVYLRLQSDAALAFLQCAAEYTALARVRVDISPAGGSPVRLFRRVAREQLEREAVPRVRCAVLALLVLASQSCATLTVDFRDIAFLCRALGGASKPALELCGVAVKCAPGDALEDSVARVNRMPDGAVMPCALFNSGVWEDHAAILSEAFIRMSLAR